MIRRISCRDINAGMYIHAFGGSWFKHPFWHSKFLLASQEDVEKVRSSDVRYVLIDDELGGVPKETVVRGQLPGPIAATAPVAASMRSRAVVDPTISESKRANERKAAKELVHRSVRAVRGVFDEARLGKAVRVGDVSRVIEEVQASLERSPNALLNVLRLKSRDEYTYAHSVAVCALMVHVARHIGLDEATAKDLGQAGLLHDIGKMAVPEDVLNKPGRLTEEEFALVKTHPEHGYQMLHEMPGMAPAALDVCRHHHEKINGGGYPFGLSGDAISIAARLGAICDVYDAVTSNRIYKDAWTPAQAITAMNSWEGHFDRSLFFSFMQSIGVFPPTMLVQLRSNCLGIVMDNGKRASRPRVCAFYSMRERCFLDPQIVTIKDSLAGDQIIAPEDPASWGLADWDRMIPHLMAARMPPLAA